MKVGICDDSYFDRKTVPDWLSQNYLKINNLEIIEFTSGEALIEYLRFNLLGS